MGILLTQVGDTGVILIDYPLACPLIPGRFYMMENYRTSYFMRKGPGNNEWVENPDRSENNNNLPTDVTSSAHGKTWSDTFKEAFYGPKERMMFLATGTCSVSNSVWSLDFPEDEIYWDARISDLNKYNPSHVDPQYMGKIYYRRDTRLNIASHMDWRSIRMARWKFNSSEMTQRQTSWFEPTNFLFTSGVNNTPVIGSANLASSVEYYHMFGGPANRVIAEVISNASKPLESLPNGYTSPTNYTWCIPSVSNPIRFRNIHVGNVTKNDDILASREEVNIVFFPPVEVGETFENVFIDNDCFRASIDCQGGGDIDIKSGFMHNIICSENTDNTNSNYVRTNFRGNKIGFNFTQNFIRHQFTNNTIGSNFSSNDMRPINFPTKNNTFIDNIISNNFTNNEIKNSMIESVISNGFSRNYLVGFSPMVRCKILKPDVKDVTFNVTNYSTYNSTFQGFVSLTDRVVDNNYSTFETGVVFPQASSITGNDATKLVLTAAGFKIAGTIYLKPATRPTMSAPTASIVNLRTIQGGNDSNFNLIPVAWDALGTVDASVKRYWDWTLNVLSVNTKITIPVMPNSTYPISLATEFLEIYSYSNDWLQLGMRNFLHDPQSKYFGQITGQNNYYLL
jgi:hypothetical protein